MPNLIEETELVISELCTNALLHGGDPITVTLRVAGRCLGGEVADRGDLFIPHPRVSEDEEHGRGLHIVGALVDLWVSTLNETAEARQCGSPSAGDRWSSSRQGVSFLGVRHLSWSRRKLVVTFSFVYWCDAKL
ncbi:ATP-binding protein [Sphaerisporangium aureirubrum]|uniref:ATP-binding protein n=1 Tax=Sphaerisporangium aureirubrum TaxID=1544736 RepID=A0ABW1NCL6_9ACTN